VILQPGDVQIRGRRIVAGKSDRVEDFRCGSRQCLVFNMGIPNEKVHPRYDTWRECHLETPYGAGFPGYPCISVRSCPIDMSGRLLDKDERISWSRVSDRWS